MNQANWRAARASAIAGTFLLALGGCSLTTVELRPHDENFVDQVQSYIHDFWCDPFDLPVAGTLSRYFPNPGEILVGYDDFYDPGTGIFPCTAKVDHRYRGGARFDISKFDSITSALLVFDVTQSRQGIEGVGNNPPISFARFIAVGDYPWVPSQGLMNYSDPRSLSDTPTKGLTFEVGVTDQVKDWISGNSRNLGFVMIGPREDFPNDNESFVSFYGNFKLVVTYDPTKNPRVK